MSLACHECMFTRVSREGRAPDPLENHKNIVFFNNTGPGLGFWVSVTPRPQLVPIFGSFTRDRDLAYHVAMQ